MITRSRNILSKAPLAEILHTIYIFNKLKLEHFVYSIKSLARPSPKGIHIYGWIQDT